MEAINKQVTESLRELATKIEKGEIVVTLFRISYSEGYNSPDGHSIEVKFITRAPKTDC